MVTKMVCKIYGATKNGKWHVLNHSHLALFLLTGHSLISVLVMQRMKICSDYWRRWLEFRRVLFRSKPHMTAIIFVTCHHLCYDLFGHHVTGLANKIVYWPQWWVEHVMGPTKCFFTRMVTKMLYKIYGAMTNGKWHVLNHIHLALVFTYWAIAH